MNHLERFHRIKTFIFDVDGVLTNSELIVMENGDLLRKMSVRDGYAIKQAIRQGFRVIIITGGSSQGVITRLRNLGVEEVHAGISDKLSVFRELVERLELDPERILYMGDDLPDYEVMRLVGLPACPGDAAPEIRQLSQYISPVKGGAGCARDVIEKVLKLKKKWLTE
jgi:3-deoxy-D-manno-octulosonate 8-phosphate phosphatase (KDO 8-P phosphatase)